MSSTTPYTASSDQEIPVVTGGPLGDQSHPSSEPEHESGHVYFNMEAGDVAPEQDDNLENNNVQHQQDDDHKSIVSSVLTADGIHDVTGFSIVCFVILIGDMSRGVMFPTLWPLVETLGGSTVNLGYAVAAFSCGRILVSPIFGGWSVTYGYKRVLVLAGSILLFGTLCYAQVQNVGSTAFLVLAQMLLGVGSGTLGVTRAFVAEVTAQRNRTTYMAWITAVQYAGFTVTPFFGALFIKVLQDSEYKFGLFRLNMYTAPACFMSCICLLTIALLAVVFQDRQRIQTKKDLKKSRRRTEIDELANTTTFLGITTYDACILGCMLLNVATKGSIASFETLGIAYASSHFDMIPSRAGTIVASCGTLGVVALLSMGYLAKWLNDIQLVCGGMIIMAVGIFSLAELTEDPEQNPSWRYIVAILLVYAIGYPIGHTAVIALFSKIVGRRPQGTFMGWFASAGSLARMVFPISSGYIANLDVSTLFLILTGVLTFATAFVLMNRHTLSLLST